MKSPGTKANKVAATDCRLEERLCKTLSKEMKSAGTKANKVAATDPSSAVPGLSVAALSGSNPDRLGTGNMQAEEQDGPIGGNTQSSHAQGIIPFSDCGWVVSGVPAGVSVRSKGRRDAVSAISAADIHGSRDVGLFPASSCAPCRHDVWVYFPELCKIFGEADALAIMASAVKIADKAYQHVLLDPATAVALLSIATALSGPADPRTTASDHICKILRLPYHVEESWRHKVRRIGCGISASMVAAAEWNILKVVSAM